MPCTTILAGTACTYNGSTIISRNCDGPSGKFETKKYEVVLPENQPRLYKAVISGVEIPLPDDPMRYTAMPNVDTKKEGIWAGAGINAANVAMTATETITSNARVLGADPFVEKGIGEEDMVVLVLPYIHSAREGVIRLGALLEKYGTYEPNGIAFSDHDEIWYLESIGGHHWIARRLPDDCYAVIANEFSINTFDLEDAMGAQKENMASADIVSFIKDNHLDLNMSGPFNARLAFGSHTAVDHIYDTPRVWIGQQYFNPTSNKWNGPDADFHPESDNLPWCRVPEFKITVEDVKAVLSNVYQGTPFDAYGKTAESNKYRPIGVNRTEYIAIQEIRNDVPQNTAAVEWFSYASNVFNAIVPQYTNVNSAPAYFTNVTPEISLDTYYWACRILSAMADPHYKQTLNSFRAYELTVSAQARHLMAAGEKEGTDLEVVNQQIADMAKKETQKILSDVLYTASMGMQNAFALNDN